jgi:hypothetical protein
MNVVECTFFISEAKEQANHQSCFNNHNVFGTIGRRRSIFQKMYFSFYESRQTYFFFGTKGRFLYYLEMYYRVLIIFSGFCEEDPSPPSRAESVWVR